MSERALRRRIDRRQRPEVGEHLLLDALPAALRVEDWDEADSYGRVRTVTLSTAVASSKPPWTSTTSQMIGPSLVS